MPHLNRPILRLLRRDNGYQGDAPLDHAKFLFFEAHCEDNISTALGFAGVALVAKAAQDALQSAHFRLAVTRRFASCPTRSAHGRRTTQRYLKNHVIAYAGDKEERNPKKLDPNPSTHKR